MSNINFFDQSEVPQPRHNVKIETLQVQPYPDGWRVKVNLEVTPFQERPNLELTLQTAAGQQVAAATILETMHHHMEFTLHIRGLASPAGDYVLVVELYYEDRAQPQQVQRQAFTIVS